MKNIETIPNKIFRENLTRLLTEGKEVPTQMFTLSGNEKIPVKAITIGNVVESYDVESGIYWNNFGEPDPLNRFYKLPIQTYRTTPIISGLKELHWIYELQSNKISDLKELGIEHWWDKFTLKHLKKLDSIDRKEFKNTIGKAYGYTVRKYNLFNNLIFNIINKPYSRDLILSLWQEDDINFQITFGGLLPCAYSFRISIIEDNDYNNLTLTLIQRSSDYLLANSINKSQYFILGLKIIDLLNNLIKNDYSISNNFNNKFIKLDKFIHTVNDLHIYSNHVEFAKLCIDTPIENIKQQEIILNRNFGKGSNELYRLYNIIKTNCKFNQKLPLNSF